MENVTVDSQTGANSQDAQAATPTAGANENAAQTSTEENSGANATQENRVPQSRFNEIIDQRNRERQLREDYEAKLRELESRLGAGTQKPNSVIDAEAKRLAERLNMDEKAAREILESQASVVRSQNAQVEERFRQMEINEWSRAIASRHADYAQVVPKMEKLFMEMTPQEQHLAVSSPRGLEMLYAYAKAAELPNKEKEAFNAGANAAYQNKAQKQALSSTPGAAANVRKDLSPEAIRNMSVKEYRERYDEINAWLAKRR